MQSLMESKSFDEIDAEFRDKIARRYGEDIAQEALIRIWQLLGKIDDGAIGPVIWRIAHNLSVDEVRKIARKAKASKRMHTAIVLADFETEIEANDFIQVVIARHGGQELLDAIADKPISRVRQTVVNQIRHLRHLAALGEL